MIVPMQRIESVEQNGGRVFVMCTSHKWETATSTKWAIDVPSLIIGEQLMANLSCPLPPLPKDKKGMTRTQTLLWNTHYERYEESVHALTHTLLGAIGDHHLFDMRDADGTSRMGQPFQIKTFAPIDLVLGQIARGGDRPTLIAKDYFRKNFGLHVPRLYAGSQRKGTRTAMDADVAVKGATDLTGKTLLIMEQAVATVTTIPKALRLWIRNCESTPKRIIVGAFHAARESLQRLQSMGSKNDPNDILHSIPVDVVVLLQHGGIDDNGYLTGPGCGDVGVMDVGLHDK